MDPKLIEEHLRVVGSMLLDIEESSNTYILARTIKDHVLRARTIELFGMISLLKASANHARIIASVLAEYQEKELDEEEEKEYDDDAF